MQSLFADYKPPVVEVVEKSKIVNERQQILEDAREIINKGREGTQWHPISKRGLALNYCSHLKGDAVKAHHMNCMKAGEITYDQMQKKTYTHAQATAYSRLFFGLLKCK